MEDGLCLLLLVLVLADKAACQAPKFVTPPGGHWSQRTVHVRGKIEQPCQAVGDPKPSYKWIMNGTDVKQPASYDGDTGLLVIEAFRPTDNGLYQCVAYNSHGTVMTSHLTLINAYLDPFPGTSEYPMKKVKATQYLSLPCYNIPRSQPAASFGWEVGQVHASHMKNGRYITNDERKIVDPEGALHFLWLSDDDNLHGFRCFMYNDVMLSRTFSRNITVLLVNEEKIHSDRDPTLVYNKDVVAMDGETATLTCIFSYYSFKGDSLVIDWYKDSVGDSLVQGRTLTIKPVNQGKEGEYACQAKLGSKVTKGIVNLRVVGLPKFLPDYQLMSQTVETGSNVTLPCKTTSAHSYSKPPVWLNSLHTIIGCPPGMFECGHGHGGSGSVCIRTAGRCDGKPDCPGDEDEKECPDTCQGQACGDCPFPKFRCHDNRNCIERRNRCNGYDDCSDQSDEIACHGNPPKQVGKYLFSSDRTDMTILDVSARDATCIHCMVTNPYGTTIGTSCLTVVDPTTDEPILTSPGDYDYDTLTPPPPTDTTRKHPVPDRTTKQPGEKPLSATEGSDGGSTIVVVIIVLVAVFVIAAAIAGMVVLYRKKRICARDQQEYESRFTDATICEMFSRSMDTLAGIRQSQLQPQQGQTLGLVSEAADSPREDLFP